MKQLVHISLILILATSLWGCRHSHNVAALVEADSLMWTRPDSSLALVQSVSPDTLDDENRAYHALLLTQAQFRNNIYPDTDTIINRALDFYADNHNRERLTRSLFYKGCFTKNKHNYLDAMSYLLLAEDNCDSTDYRMIGMINLHMGDTYLLRYMSGIIPIEKYRKSLKCFEILRDSSKMCLCYGMLGGLYRMADKVNAVKFLSKAIEIAETIKDTTKVLNYSEYLMRHYLVIKDIEQANRVKNIYLSKYGSLNPDLALDLSYLYAVKYMPDSSSYYIKVINGLTLDDKQKLMAIKANSALQAAKGNYKEAMRLSEQFSYISDSLSHNNDKLAIANMEFERANQRKEELTSQLQVSRNVNVSIMLICLVAIVSVILTVFLYRRQRNIVASNRELYRQLSKEKINEHKELSELLANNNDLKLIFERYLTFIRTLVNICTVLPEKHGLEIIRKAINPEISSELVSGLVQFVNMQNDNILNKLSSQYPKISRQQIGLICLTALDFSDAEIALILGYRTSSIRVLRRRLEKKLDFDGKFKELLKNQGAV